MTGQRSIAVPDGPLTVAECRALLGPDAPETDEQVIELRDFLGGLAELLVDSVLKQQRAPRGYRPAQEPS